MGQTENKYQADELKYNHTNNNIKCKQSKQSKQKEEILILDNKHHVPDIRHLSGVTIACSSA